jgi:hypothetical protein
MFARASMISAASVPRGLLAPPVGLVEVYLGFVCYACAGVSLYDHPTGRPCTDHRDVDLIPGSG